MRIQTKVKDYYDYVEHLYGGGDPRLIYKRTHIDKTEFPAKVIGSDKIGFWTMNNREETIRIKNVPTTIKVEYLDVIICGKHYIVERKSNLLEILSHRIIEKRELDDEDRRVPFWWKHTEYTMGMHYYQFDNIAKHIGHPVFIYEGRTFGDMLRVSYNIPNLGDMGFAKYIPAEIMYQNIAYYMGNVVNHGVDLEPPVKLEDKHRIVQHGFDMKLSFRHRK